jgi:hypothetical protein
MGQLKLVRPGNGRAPAEQITVPLTAAGLERVWAETKEAARKTGAPPAPRATQHFVPPIPPVAAVPGQRSAARSATAPASFSIVSGIRGLVAGLILVALLPNLTLGAIVWLGVINAPWSRAMMASSAETPVQAVQPIPVAVLTTPGTLEARAGEDISFPIAIDGTDGVPARSVIAISGLPQGSTLSEGRPYGEGEWNLKSDEIGDLHLVVANSANGESKLEIRLIAPNDEVIADAETVLKVRGDRGEAGAGDAAAMLVAMQDPNPTFVTKPDLTAAQTWYAHAQGFGATGTDKDVSPTADTTSASGDAERLPTDSPPQIKSDDGKWIEPSVFVNLREGPSSSAAVVAVVAKGAKLPVLGRKRGWIQVTDPGTSKSGWIYSGNVAGSEKPQRVVRRADRAETSTASDSFWPSLGQWLAGP